MVIYKLYIYCKNFQDPSDVAWYCVVPNCLAKIHVDDRSTIRVLDNSKHEHTPPSLVKELKIPTAQPGKSKVSVPNKYRVACEH